MMFAAALCNVVEQAHDPTVCMATHSRGRVSVALLGSVTERLLREVHVPFVLVGPAFRDRLADRLAPAGCVRRRVVHV